jgi:hypothetical protein
VLGGSPLSVADAECSVLQLLRACWPSCLSGWLARLQYDGGYGDPRSCIVTGGAIIPWTLGIVFVGRAADQTHEACSSGE